MLDMHHVSGERVGSSTKVAVFRACFIFAAAFGGHSPHSCSGVVTELEIKSQKREITRDGTGALLPVSSVQLSRSVSPPHTAC